MKIKENKRLFAFAVSLLICILVYSVFIGQVLWSDVLTFHKKGDDLRLCFPAIKKIAEYFQAGAFYGVDIASFNGATEFFYRSNLPHHFLLVVIAGYLTKFLPARGIYLILYFMQLFLCSYFSTRLAQRFFQMENRIALLFTCSWITVALYEYWYLSFYLVTTLIPVVLYFEFMLFEVNHFKWKEKILFSFPYVLSLTSGYITLSVSLTVAVFVITVAYGVWFKKVSLKNTLRKAIVPFAVGVGVCIPFCLGLFVYQKSVVQASMTMFDAMYLKLSTLDIKRIVTGAFVSENPIEQIQLVTLGMFWVFVLILLVYFNSFSIMKREERFLFRFGFIINILFIMIAMETILPFSSWFYSMVPIFGSMHLPLRYLMITLILLYLGMALAMEYIPDLKQQKMIKLFAVAVLLLGVLCTITAPYLSKEKVNMEKLLIELFLMTAILYFIYRNGLRHVVTIILIGFFILLPGITFFYDENELSVSSSVMKERSIVYDTEKQEHLDNFIATLDSKDRYLFAAFDKIEYLPDFLPGNYGWYGYSKYVLSNYSGYEHHLANPKEYREHFSWFDVMDWNYIADTRGDFVVMDQESIDEQKEVLDQIVDWEESNEYLDSIHRILKLKKFIPSYYTGENFVEDHADTMDNGYFYCPDLKKKDLVEFGTNHATYFRACINASVKSTVAFLLYPNRNYHYYVNGEEIQPVIQNMQAYIPINKGKNSIQVLYKDKLAEIKNIMFFFYYIIIVLCAVCVAVEWRQSCKKIEKFRIIRIIKEKK